MNRQDLNILMRYTITSKILEVERVYANLLQSL